MTKSPEECESHAEGRSEIDRIDREIIALIGRHVSYVQAAAKFKINEQDRSRC